jgi:hypothetical protein
MQQHVADPRQKHGEGDQAEEDAKPARQPTIPLRNTGSQ